MKTKLNILCVFIFVAMGASIADTVYAGFQDFLWGFKKGYKESAGIYMPDTASVASVDHADPVFISLKPNTIGQYTDSIYNAKSGEWLPLQYRSVVVSADKAIMPWWKTAICMFCVLISGILGLVQIGTFCLLIYAINKSIIFEWSNVFKLRLMGWAMLISFLLYALYKYVYYSANVAGVDIPEYTITSDGIADFYELILGLGILLMAEVFAIGLRLREEQELTI